MPSRNVWFHLYKLLSFEKDLSPEQPETGPFKENYVLYLFSFFL